MAAGGHFEKKNLVTFFQCHNLFQAILSQKKKKKLPLKKKIWGDLEIFRNFLFLFFFIFVYSKSVTLSFMCIAGFLHLDPTQQ